MIGRNIARKVTRNLTHPIGLGWSLGTSPDGGPGPIAAISLDSAILPSFYTTSTTEGGYFPAQTDLQTYRGYTGHGVFLCGWFSTPFDNIVKRVWTSGDGRTFEGANCAFIYETAGLYTITLTVTDWIGRTSSATRQVKIYARGTGNYSMRHYGAYDEIGPLVGYDYALSTYYVDAVIGDDNYSGKAQTVGGIEGGTGKTIGPWKTWDKVMSAMTKTNATALTTWTMKPGDEVLFNRGQTFPVSVEKNFGHGGMSQGIRLGAYGTGANPLVQWVTPAGVSAWQPNHSYALNDRFYLNDKNGQFGRVWKVTTPYTSGSVWKQTEGQNIDNTVLIKSANGGGFLSIADIDFSFLDGTTSIIDGLWSAVNNTRNGTVIRCVFNDPYNAAISWNANVTAPNTNQPYGMFIHGCSANQNNASRSAVVLLIYGQYNALSMIGNSADKSGNHINYLETVQYAVIADNTFSRPGFGRTALRITGHDIAAGLEAKFIHVTRNNFLGWVDDQNGDNIIIEELGPGGAVHNGGGTRYSFTLINIAPNSGHGKDGTDIIFDKNVVTNYELGVSVINRKRVRLMNNIFASPSPSATAVMVGEGSVGGSQDFACDDIKIWHNTFVQNGNTAPTANNPVIMVNGTDGVGDGHGYHTNLSIKGNLSISTSARSDVLVAYRWGDSYGQITNVAQDYNLIDSNSANWSRDNQAGVSYNLADWRTAFSKDGHSLKSAATVVTAPTPVSHSPGFPSTLAAGLAEVASYKASLQLQSISAAIDAGGTENVLTDILSVQRPVGSANDIGAFEYPTVVTPAVAALLLEGSTGYLLAETGDKILTESGGAVTTGASTAASTLTGSEIIIINQGGVTVRTTVEDLAVLIRAP